MAEYKTIKGFKTQNYATDPVPTSAAWSSGTAMNTARRELENGGFGTQTAALTAGGSDFSVNAETYDGTTWTEVNNLNVSRAYIYGFGATNTAGLMVAGYNPWGTNFDSSETYDGTSWTEGHNINTARAGGAMGGTSTAGFIAGGYPPGPTGKTETEIYDGTCWSETGDLSAGRYVPGGGGTQTAGLCIAGYPALDTTFEFNGTSWSTHPATLNTGKDYTLSCGSQSDAINFCDGPASALTEKFNGTTWTEVADLSTARYAAGTLDGGSGTAALALGNSPVSDIVEEWNDYSSDTTQTFLNEGQIWYNTTGNALKYTSYAAGAWASATATPTGLMNGAAAGTSTAALTFGGRDPSPVAVTFEFDGTAWTSGGAYPLSLNRPGGWGTQTAALGAGGAPPYTATSNTYDGTSWTAVNPINTARSSFQSFGTQTAAVMAGGGTDPGRVSTVEEYDGTSWATANSMPAVKADGGGGGTQTAGLGFLGTIAPGAGGRTANSYAYDGTSWTATNSCNTARSGVGSGGTTETNTMTYGGEPPAYIADTEQYDGTSWTEVANLATARQGIFNPLSQGTQQAQLCIMGDTGTAVTTVEEWTSPLTVKTVTVS